MMSDEVKKVRIATVEVKVSELDEFKGLIKALGENLGALPKDVKVALKELMPDLVVDEGESIIGSIAYLNSGSCAMTVTGIMEDDHLELTYFKDAGVVAEPIFVPYQCVYLAE